MSTVEIPFEIQRYNDSDFIFKLVRTHQEHKQIQQGYDTDSISDSDCSGLLHLSEQRGKSPIKNSISD